MGLWLGPASQRPYHPAYTHAVFRGWYDFGTGALGDMGHYSFRQIFEMLKLGSPSSVEAGRSQFWNIQNFTWHKQINRVSYPQASMIHWEFPARGELPPVTLHWYDGGLRPPMPSELEADGEGMPEEGLLLVGSRGRSSPGFRGPPAVDSQGADAGFPTAGAEFAAARQRAGPVRLRLSRRGACGGMFRKGLSFRRNDLAGHDRPSR